MTESSRLPVDASPQEHRGERFPRIGSDALFQGQRHIVIQHGGDEYHLRITAAGKLILTK